MTTIRKRGDLQYQAIVKRKGHPLQSKTCQDKDVEVWARDMERDIHRGIYMPRQEAEKTTLAEPIKRYCDDVSPSKREHLGPALKVSERQ